ncbi:MAG: TSUP family transporter [Colwellia sp.]
MEVANFSIELLSFLFLIAIVAGLIDTLAGGGGLLSLPALILAGIPPLSALGTNKLQGSMGTATATYLMFKNRRIRYQECKPLMQAAFIGAALGAIAVQFMNTELLSFIIPMVLLFIVIYFITSPLMKNKRISKGFLHRYYKKIVVPVIGIYDGMFGPGTGSFFALAGVSCQGHDLIKSTAVAKSLNFATNIASLIIFITAGHIVWIIGLVMMLGQAIGAYFGAHFLYKIKPFYLRIIVVLMSSSMLIKYSDSMGWFS